MKTEAQIRDLLVSIKTVSKFMDEIIESNEDEFPETEKEKEDFSNFFQGMKVALSWMLK